ncbi:hypothetical protein Pmani_000577 [Petrolisthes manimaculis]|uniref:Uncharacterized protein n=1 Tax=Petrolisthes manimaculis TaxID=1843537 RepID=A0AAE1PGC6_9EUCA|nr:hypothetical protein Pmani_021496 [Petrolisthes manimaculis]KAK4329046.1 hypothetical protein Pmani_000577 [Petrolisthes manimaculis]
MAAYSENFFYACQSLGASEGPALSLVHPCHVPENPPFIGQEAPPEHDVITPERIRVLIVVKLTAACRVSILSIFSAQQC